MSRSRAFLQERQEAPLAEVVAALIQAVEAAGHPRQDNTTVLLYTPETDSEPVADSEPAADSEPVADSEPATDSGALNPLPPILRPKRNPSRVRPLRRRPPQAQ